MLDAPAVPASFSKGLGSPADIGKRRLVLELKNPFYFFADICSRKPSKKAAEMAKRSKAVIPDSESDVDATRPPE